MNSNDKKESIQLIDFKSKNSQNSILIKNNMLASDFMDEFNSIPGLSEIKEEKINNKYNDLINFLKIEVITLFTYSGFLILFFNDFQSYFELLLIFSLLNTIILYLFNRNKIIKIPFKNYIDFIFIIIIFDLSYFFLFLFFNNENSLEKIMMISFDIIFIIYYNTFNNLSNKYEYALIIVPFILFFSIIIIILFRFNITYNFFSCILFLIFKCIYSVRKKYFIQDKLYNSSTFFFYFFFINFILMNIIIFLKSLIKLDILSSFFDCYYPLYNIKIIQYLLLSIFYIIYIKKSNYIFKNNYKSILIIQPFTPIFSLFWAFSFGFIEILFFKKIIILILIVFCLQSLGNIIIYYLIINSNKQNIKIKRRNSKQISYNSLNYFNHYFD